MRYNTEKGGIAMQSSNKFSLWSFLSSGSFLCGCYTFFKGMDKLTNYKNTDYSSINAYVGGDAYNYIINGTHATAYFVLTAMFVLTAVGLLIVHYVSRHSITTVEKPVDELPEI